MKRIVSLLFALLLPLAATAAPVDPAAHPLVEDRRDVAAEIFALELDPQDRERGAQEEHHGHADGREPSADAPTRRGAIHPARTYHGGIPARLARPSPPDPDRSWSEDGDLRAVIHVGAFPPGHGADPSV